MRMSRPAVLGLVGPLVIGASALGAVACSSSSTSTTAATTTGAPATAAPPRATEAPATSTPSSRPATSAPASSATTPAAPGQVTIVDYAFAPETITVKVGDTVTWTNKDDFDHWVLSEDESTLDSKALGTGQSYSKTVTQPGTIAYYCNIHNGMKGTVVVQ